MRTVQWSMQMTRSCQQGWIGQHKNFREGDLRGGEPLQSLKDAFDPRDDASEIIVNFRLNFSGTVLIPVVALTTLNCFMECPDLSFGREIMEHIQTRWALAADPDIPVEVFRRRAAQRRAVLVAQALSFLFDGGLLLLYAINGTTTFATVALYLTAGFASTLTALVFSELHFNDRFKDHYLTIPNQVANTTIQLVSIYLWPEVGYYFVCVIFIVVGLGSLRMTTWQTGIIWTYATLGLTVLFLLNGDSIAMPMKGGAEHALALLAFASALARCASAGLYGSTLRGELYKSRNKLKKANARIAELANTDELTGTFNRRRILEKLDEEIKRAHRTGRPLSVAIIDLDHFKNINDSHGHPAGDEVLRSFVLSIAANIRDVDWLGRYGGEEFLLLLTETSLEHAVRTVDRLRNIFAYAIWPDIAQDLVVTFSAGVSGMRQGDTADRLVARADQALYKAKIKRNIVVAD
jgi:diguanylate cyclase (GGDEF)-like protein